MSIPVILWVAVAAALTIVIVYRKIVAGGTDELMHVSDASAIEKQAEAAKKLQKLDRTSMTLGILTALYGVCLAALYVYQAFVTSSQHVQ